MTSIANHFFSKKVNVLGRVAPTILKFKYMLNHRT